MARVGARPIPLHSIRHSYASSALANGADIVWISRRLGHSRIQVTIDLYVHVSAETDRAQADAMGALLLGSGASG